MIKKLLFLFLILILVYPVNALVYEDTYHDDLYDSFSERIDTGTVAGGATFNKLYFTHTDKSQYAGLFYIGNTVMRGVSYAEASPFIGQKDLWIKASVDGTEIATGTITYYVEQVPATSYYVVDAAVWFDDFDIDTFVDSGYNLCDIEIENGLYPIVTSHGTLAAGYNDDKVVCFASATNIVVNRWTGITYDNPIFASAYLASWDFRYYTDVEPFRVNTITLQPSITTEFNVSVGGVLYEYDTESEIMINYADLPLVLKVKNPFTELIYTKTITKDTSYYNLDVTITPDPPIIKQNFTLNGFSNIDIDDINQISYYIAQYYDSSYSQTVISYEQPKIMYRRVAADIWDVSTLENNVYYYNKYQVNTSAIYQAEFNFVNNQTINNPGYYAAHMVIKDINNDLYTTLYQFVVSGDLVGYSNIQVNFYDVTNGYTVDYVDMEIYRSLDNINYNYVYTSWGTESGYTDLFENDYWYYFNATKSGYDPVSSTKIFLLNDQIINIYMNPTGTATKGTIKFYIQDSNGNSIKETVLTYNGNGYTDEKVFGVYNYFTLINFDYGIYNYSVSKSGYQTSYGQITLDSLYEEILVTLISEETIPDIEEEYQGIIKKILDILLLLGFTYEEAKVLFGMYIALGAGLLCAGIARHVIVFITGCGAGLITSIYLSLLPFWIVYLLALLGVMLLIALFLNKQ